MAHLVRAAQTLTNETANDSRDLFVMSDGHLLAIIGDETARSYVTSSDSGTTWSAPVGLPGWPGNTTIGAMVQNGDTLYMVLTELLFASQQLWIAAYTYSGGALTGTVHAFNVGIPVSSTMAADAGWDGSRLHVSITLNQSCMVGAWNPASPATPPAFVTAMTVVVSATPLGVVCTGSTIYFGYGGNMGGGVSPYLVSATYSGGVYSFGSPELVISSLSLTGMSLSLDGTTLDLVTAFSSGQVYAIRRPGSGVYGTLQNIATAEVGASLSLTKDGSDLYVFYRSVTAQTGGEIYLVSRTSGSWNLPTGFATGTEGYSTPKSAAGLTSGRYDVVYQRGADVYYGGGLQGSAPDAPVITAPSGGVIGLVSTITGIYSNTAAPTDHQSAVEYQVYRVSDAHVMWDSGKITATTIHQDYGTGSNVADANYIAPQALSYGIQYAVKARVWDSDLLPTQVSAYSTPVSFTPAQAGTVTITTVTTGGVGDSTPPTTLGAPTIDSILRSWSQPQAHNADQYQDWIYLVDGVTLVATTGPQTIGGGPVASGGTFLSGPWTPGLANSTVYKLVCSLRDATSLAWSPSATWELDTSWTPPAGVSGLTVIPVPTGPYILPAWTNPGGTTAITVQRSLTGQNAWVTLSSGSLRTSLKDRSAALLTAYDYRVIAYDATGTPSAPVIATNITLGVNGLFGVSLTDTVDTSVVAWLGVVDQYESSTKWDRPEEALKFVPLGSELPIVSYRLIRFRQAPGRTYLVPPVGWDANNNPVTAKQTLAALLAMRDAHHVLHYNDVDGSSFSVVIENVSDAFANDKWPLRIATFDLTEVAGSGVPLVE